MASPSTSSSTASPHPGQSAASSGGQLPGSAHPKMDSLRNGSYLEPIPLNYPKIIPLEWSFPLVHHVRTETTDSGSLKTTISAGPLADDFPSNANTPSLSSNLSARLPANVVTDLGVQTPSAAIAPVPSPAITSTISGANQAIVQTQKPWRIMWASYVMKAQDPATADQPASPNEPNRNTRESVRSTPHSSEFLQVPQSQPSNQLPEQKPSHEIITDRKKLTSRSRAGSSASRRSNDSPASVGQRPRKKRHRDGPPDLRSDSPDFLLGQYNGKERQSQYKQAIENLIRPTRTSRLDPLLAAKKRFLTRDESARKVDLSQDMQTDAVDSASDDLLCQHGRLPQRLALIEAGQASLPSKAPENKDDTPRLYTFSMTSPSVDLSEYPGLEANIFAGLELEASGSFTASDLFPALFNDNGIYTAPTSMHPASIHPIPSAAALGPGQAPFFLSSLNISSSSNREAVTASEAYLKAVEAHVLDAVQKSYNPNEQPINEHMHDEAATKLSRYQAYGPGVRCGEGIIYPTLTHKLSAASEGSTPTSFQGEDDTAFPCSPFLSCHAHFTAADLRVAINIRNVDYGSFPGAFGNEHSAAGLVPGFRPQKKEGRLVVLCPTRVPAIFARWYGEPSETVSRKQAAAEQAEVADAVPLFADLLGEHGSSLYHDVGGDRWALCTLSSNVEVVWPGSLLLCRRRSTHRHSHASTAEKLSRPILPDRMRSTMAKASPRVPRNLYFRPFRDRSGDLAAMTVKYIDFFNQEKVKDRRTKAEKQLAEQSSSSVSSDLHENPPSEQTQTISSERGSMQVVSGPSQDDFSPDSRQCGTDAGNTDRLVNELGCPTIDTISSVLDSLLDSAVDTPQGSGGILSPHGSGMTGASVDQESTHCKAADGSMIYPTPQSGPNSANQASAAPAGTTDAFEGSARPTSPLQNESRSLADILGDFTWSNYTDGLAPLQQATSRPVSSSGGAGAYGIRGVFDDPSTFDLFDSGGLTEEDFSFFDSPMAADISLPQSSTHFVPQEPLDLTEITADEIASFVNTAGPIDHFGHLMPQSDQGLLVKPIQPNDPSGPDTTQFEARQLQDFGSYEAATPFSGAEIISTAAGWDSVHTKISPPTARKYHVRCADPFSGGTQLEQIICSSQSSLQAILRSPFGPIRLLLPSPHLPDSASCLKNGNSQENENDALSTYNGMPLRAERIRAAISGPPLSTRNGEDVFSSKRDWQAAELPVESSSDESIYASSDEDCAAWVDKRLHRPVRARSPKHARRLSPKSLLELAFFYHLPNQDESPAAEVHARNKEGPVKINRGEKEAVATIFFQHTIENIDFRERRSIEVRGASALAQLSCAIIPFGSPKLSRKLASALPTEIAAYHRHALTTLSISALRSWSKLGLGPRNGVKDVQAIVVAPKDLLDDTSRSALGDWLKRVGAIWQVRCLLPPALLLFVGFYWLPFHAGNILTYSSCRIVVSAITRLDP